MSDTAIEYRYPIGGGHEALLRFDGRMVEFINLANYGNVRFPFPETTVERGEPNRKGEVEYKFISPMKQEVMEFPVEAGAVAGFDEFLAKVEQAAGRG